MGTQDTINYGKQPELIEVGMGVTLRTGMGGLYRPFTVVAVKRNGRELDIQADKVILLSDKRGWEDNDDKAFEPDPRAKIETITLRNDETFIAKGAPKEWYATRYYVGHRRDWTDFSQ